MSVRNPARWENIFLVAIFCAALIAHFHFATRNWSSEFMPGHEFRQTQTAIVSRYIDEQNNFSLLYETPLMGKPWVSILMEVPFYEWSVVLLSRSAGVTHVVAARTVSLTCFYLTLPALFMLLGRFGVPRPRRLLALAFILTCPIYIFYSRAFLMESMEIMCCAWFLLGFVRTMDERHWGWLALAIMAGTLAALIKSVTFAVWLVPAAGYGAWMLRRDLRSRQSWVVPLKTVGWGLATVVVALGMLQCWINLTDPLKAAHPSAWIFTAKNLSVGNWGLLAMQAKFSPTVWGELLKCWQEAIMSPWIIILGLVAGLIFFRQVRGRILGLAAMFFVAQLMFPYAYAYQSYYFYACTMFLLGALAFVGFGVLDSRLPRWCGWLLVVLPLAVQINNYWHGYRAAQILVSNGGLPLTSALRDLTPKKSVIIVAGQDWSGIYPYYSQRKALMIRNGLEHDYDYIERAFAALADEDVAVLVLTGTTRGNSMLADLAAEKFGMEAEPSFSYPDADVYCHPKYRDYMQECLRGNGEATMKPRASDQSQTRGPFAIPSNIAGVTFWNISPSPYRGNFEFGVSHMLIDGNLTLFAHANSDLWLPAPAQAKQISWDYGIIAGAYEQAGTKTDGVELLITGETPDGKSRQIYRRLLDPVNVPGDRGLQRVTIPYQPLPGENLQFSTRPNKTASFDWAYWLKIEVK